MGLGLERGETGRRQETRGNCDWGILRSLKGFKEFRDPGGVGLGGFQGEDWASLEFQSTPAMGLRPLIICEFNNSWYLGEGSGIQVGGS